MGGLPRSTGRVPPAAPGRGLRGDGAGVWHRRCVGPRAGARRRGVATRAHPVRAGRPRLGRVGHDQHGPGRARCRRPGRTRPRCHGLVDDRQTDHPARHHRRGPAATVDGRIGPERHRHLARRQLHRVLVVRRRRCHPLPPHQEAQTPVTSPFALPKQPPTPATEPRLRTDAALQTLDLSKDYGDGMGLVSELDLVVGKGELVMLVGPNGAGKSTFLGLAAGMLEPSNGWAFIAGHPAGTVPARAALSYLPDSPVLYDDLSLGEHIEYIARLHRTVDWQDYSDDLVEMFGLTDRIDDLPSRFSRGLKQKTGLILGLIRPFSLMLVDEPFVGLDTPGQETLVEILSDVVEQGATVICSTHQLDLVPAATRCVGLRDGGLVYDGPATAAKIRELVGGE
ncbi:MAG: ABC transporter ATP-binding protein [Acidimicrobiia bacterium]|nr:ABC transporter ATP-binding protein [Acidimicrobiia bacterium]